RARARRPVPPRGHLGGEDPQVHRVLRSRGRPDHRHALPRRDRAGRALPSPARSLAPAQAGDDAGSAGGGAAGGRAHADPGRGAAGGGAAHRGNPPRPRLLMDRDPSLAEFTAAVRRPDREIPLARAALLIAAAEPPALDVAGYLSRLNGLADAAEPARRARDALSRLHRLREFLFEEMGF